MKTISRAGIFFLALIGSAYAIETAYGPFDYTNPEHFYEKLPIVEQHHWNDDVAALRSGVRSAYPMNALNYVLRVFPNHHPALDAMGRLWRRHMAAGEIPVNANPEQTPEYWFERAAEFSPLDPIPPLLFGMHLQKTGQPENAIEQFARASALAPDSAEVHYALGLAYFELKELDKSSSHAERAYELGYPLPGLRNKLLAAGVWD